MKQFQSKVREAIDPGFGTRYQQDATRIINKNGSFNVIRKGVGLSYRNIYQDLVKMSWARFLLVGVLLIFSLNIFFAFLYVGVGLDEIEGEVKGNGFLHNFSQAFYNLHLIFR